MPSQRHHSLQSLRPAVAPQDGVIALLNYEWAHHVVLLMLENVAVPHVFFSASPWTYRIAHRGCRQAWQIELHDHGRDFTRVHAHRVFPSDLVRIGWHRLSRIAPVARISRERLPLNQLNVDQVEVDRMGVAG